MKRTIFLLLFAFSISVSFSQKRVSYEDGIYRPTRLHKEKELSLSAGDYLKKAANYRLTSTLTGVTSGVLMGLSSSIDDNQNKNMVLIGGAAIGVVSIVTHFLGINCEYKAGVKLKSERRSSDQSYIQPAKDGIGLNMTF